MAAETKKATETSETTLHKYQQECGLMEGRVRRESGISDGGRGIPGSASCRVRNMGLSWRLRQVDDELDFSHVEAEVEASHHAEMISVGPEKQNWIVSKILLDII